MPEQPGLRPELEQWYESDSIRFSPEVLQHIQKEKGISYVDGIGLNTGSEGVESVECYAVTGRGLVVRWIMAGTKLSDNGTFAKHACDCPIKTQPWPT